MQKIILSLTLLFVANAYAESHNKTVFCAEQVYVKSQGTFLNKGVRLKEMTYDYDIKIPPVSLCAEYRRTKWLDTG